MYCSNCGTQNEDNVMFCRNCGTPLRQGDVNPNQMNSAAPVYRGGPRQSGGQLVNALSELIQSPLYLVATIALTSQILLAVIAAATGYSQLAQMLYTIMDNSGMYYSDYYYQIAPALNALSAASAAQYEGPQGMMPASWLPEQILSVNPHSPFKVEAICLLSSSCLN